MTENQKKYKLSSVLKNLAKDSRTGTLICVNEESLQGRIYLHEGRPALARCRNFQGKDAIDLIRKHLLVSLKFYSNKNLVTLQKEEKKVIDITPDNEPADVQDIEAEYDSLVDISSLAQLQDDKKLEIGLSAQLKDIITEELTEYIGPLAGILVSDLAENTRVIDALNILAHEIEDVDAAIEFTQKVKSRI